MVVLCYGYPTDLHTTALIDRGVINEARLLEVYKVVQRIFDSSPLRIKVVLENIMHLNDDLLSAPTRRNGISLTDTKHVFMTDSKQNTIGNHQKNTSFKDSHSNQLSPEEDILRYNKEYSRYTFGVPRITHKDANHDLHPNHQEKNILKRAQTTKKNKSTNGTNNTETKEIEDIYSDESNGLTAIKNTSWLVKHLKKLTSDLENTNVIVVITSKYSSRFYGLSKVHGYYTGYPIAICTIQKYDTIKNIAEVLVHEILHLLGSSHDGEGNSCSKIGYIMEPTYTDSKALKTISSCTVKAVKNNQHTRQKKNEAKRS
ncbi:hypothetical protein NEOKW01_0204 [Nematocida sp. AWRm80]|nr:hypothetical protein NEOKW01_0204 [Nematocida sp. AWRm80]